MTILLKERFHNDMLTQTILELRFSQFAFFVEEIDYGVIGGKMQVGYATLLKRFDPLFRLRVFLNKKRQK